MASCSSTNDWNYRFCSPVKFEGIVVASLSLGQRFQNSRTSSIVGLISMLYEKKPSWQIFSVWPKIVLICKINLTPALQLTISSDSQCATIAGFGMNDPSILEKGADIYREAAERLRSRDSSTIVHERLTRETAFPYYPRIFVEKKNLPSVKLQNWNR